jgi:hypothetical protein
MIELAEMTTFRGTIIWRQEAPSEGASVVMRGWRRVIGTMLIILLPAFVLVCGGLLLVLLESIYADVHWTSKYPVYVVISSAIVFLCACVTGGVWLRKSNG